MYIYYSRTSIHKNLKIKSKMDQLYVIIAELLGTYIRHHRMKILEKEKLYFLVFQRSWAQYSFLKYNIKFILSGLQ